MEAQKSHGLKPEAAPEQAERADRNAHSHLESTPEETKKESKASVPRTKKIKNNVRKLRTERMMSKAELARRAGLSTLTVDRVERGMSCRMDTKRKILEALELTPSDRVMVFGEAEED
jgi:DNA-binding XRE family transcriptional regulator